MKKIKPLHFLTFLLSISIIAIVLIYNTFFYGITQLYGQLAVIDNAQPVEKLLHAKDFPDSLKSKIKLVQIIRRFAIDSIGLNDTDSYKNVLNQHGRPILWNVTACPPFQLNAYKWSFPLVGSFSYKGFFHFAFAEKEQLRLEKLGYETRIRPVTAWSTLGHLNDPILSNNLTLPVGELANLIIHEMTHGTLYIPNDVTYNENLASYIGNEGAIFFLTSVFGKDSKELEEYNNFQSDHKKFIKLILNGAKTLDSLYHTFDNHSLSVKQKRKEEVIKMILQNNKNIRYHTPKRFDILNIFKEKLPNNNFFASSLRYHSQQDDFKNIFYGQFKGDFKKYIKHLKKTYPTL